MSIFNIFLYEFKHFSKSKAKVMAYFCFVFGCLYALYNGFYLENKQRKTIVNIEQKRKEGIEKILNWYQQGKTGPEDRPWIDITTPYWALWNLPTYTIKSPSPLLPLGVGQAEQYGFYKKVTNRSSTYDNDMVEELANPERLINGNIDFSFLVLFLLPLLLIIFTYNIGGYEKETNFEKLVVVQVGNYQKWIGIRLAFYVLLLLLTVSILILSVGVVNSSEYSHFSNMGLLLFLATMYIGFWTVIFFIPILNSKGSKSQAFKMISLWILLCILIPASVHQYASVKYPSNLMTDYLDAKRKESSEVYEWTLEKQANQLLEIYPNLINTHLGRDTSLNKDIIGNSLGAIVNRINKHAIHKIEMQNEEKNRLITESYWFNPISFFQNKWNSLTDTDYQSYKKYRSEVQKAIDKKIELLVFDLWNKKKIDKIAFEYYLKQLN